MVLRLLGMRNHTFPRYTQQKFEAALSHCFRIELSDGKADSKRRLYLMRSL